MTPIPRTLAETVPALNALLSKEDRRLLQKAKNAEEVFSLIALGHHHIGRYLRNEWGLWQNSPLAQDLKDNHGITHPDDMSHAILMNYSKAIIRTRYERILDG